MKEREKLKILFLCTGNSARSILAEYLLRHMDARFATYSAGAAPTGTVHPMAKKVLRETYGIDASDAASQSIQEFSELDLDLVVTVCDHAHDTCPVWPYNTPVLVHWGLPDPAALIGTEDEIEALFRQVARQIHQRLERFCALPLASLEREALANRLRAIGED